MPRLIKNGAIVEDSWLPVDAQAQVPAANQICTLEQWLVLESKASSAVQLEPDQPPAPLLEHLGEINLIVVNFTAFMDGRGFTYGRELRERGYQGELRAGGHFIRDQMTYLHRVGFDAFQPADDELLEEAVDGLSTLTEFYQAAIDQPIPLFRRR